MGDSNSSYDRSIDFLPPYCFCDTFYTFYGVLYSWSQGPVCFYFVGSRIRLTCFFPKIGHLKPQLKSFHIPFVHFLDLFPANSCLPINKLYLENPDLIVLSGESWKYNNTSLSLQCFSLRQYFSSKTLGDGLFSKFMNGSSFSIPLPWFYPSHNLAILLQQPLCRRSTKSTPFWSLFRRLTRLHIIVLMTKVYYSNIVGLHSQIIRGKDMSGFWRNSYSGYLMLSPSYEWSYRENSYSGKENAATRVWCFYPRKPIRDSLSTFIIWNQSYSHPLLKIYQYFRLQDESKNILRINHLHKQSRHNETFLSFHTLKSRFWDSGQGSNFQATSNLLC